MYDAIIWLLVIELLGLLAFPISFAFFSYLPDRGTLFSKPLALLLASYVFWLAGHVFIIGRFSEIAIVAGLAGLSVFLIRSHGSRYIAFLQSHWKCLLTGELVFLAVYFLWIAIVTQSPAMTNTEKPMDFGFVNAIIRADQFPVEDPWLAGSTISYYYFGHLMVAFLTKLGGISSAVSMNLGPPLIAAMAAVGAFSLVYNLVRIGGGGLRPALIFGLGAPLFVVLIGSLEGAMEFFFSQGWGSEDFWGWVGIDGLRGIGAAEPSFYPKDHIWWWRASRIITSYDASGALVDTAITEFPFFIFLLGDLHAHMMSLPFLLIALAIFLNIFMVSGPLETAWKGKQRWRFILISLFLGALAFINLWDFPVFVGIFVAVMIFKNLHSSKGDLVAACIHTAKICVPVVVLAIIMFLPFYITVEGRAPLLLPLRDVNTRPFIFCLIWGLFLTITITFLLKQLWSLGRSDTRCGGPLAIATLITLAPLLIWTLLELIVSAFHGTIIDGLANVGLKLLHLFPLLVIVAASFHAGIVRSIRSEGDPMAFVLLLMAMAFYLLLGVELFYLDDLFFVRINTVFKAYFQSWLILAVVSTFALYYLWSSVRRGRTMLLKVSSYTWASLIAVLILCSLYYPVGAILDRAHASDDPPTLNGLAYLEKSHPEEYEAIMWLREDAPWGRIVEAVGTDYSEFGRVSSSTGLPTILGWPTHEEHWRGSRRPLENREVDVRRIYLSDNQQEVIDLLDKYKIRYIFIGDRERSRYPGINLNNFTQFMNAVYTGGNGVTIFERIEETN